MTLLPLAIAFTREDLLWLIATGIGIVILAVVWFLISKAVRKSVETRVRSYRVDGMEQKDLKTLEKKGLLTPEETRLVRQAMARQFIASTEAPRTAPTEGPPVSALAILQVEAEKIDAQRPIVQPTGPPPVASNLPPHLRPMETKSRDELLDLVQAGFLSREDFDLLVSNRSRA